MTQGFHSFKTPVRIDSFQPHGHFRLVAKTLEIFYPETGKLEMISSVSNWTNSWHTSHIYEDDAAPLVPKGAVLVITGYYDNTPANKQNPDPDQWVGLGSRTADEMSHAWIAVTHLDDEGYARLVAERRSEEAQHAERPAATERQLGTSKSLSIREALSIWRRRRARTMARRRPGDCDGHGRSIRSARKVSGRSRRCRRGGLRVAPFFDGWYPNPDGTVTLSFGYSNLNREEVVEIPLGPDNFIEPKEYRRTAADVVPAGRARLRPTAAAAAAIAASASGACSRSRCRRASRATSCGRCAYRGQTYSVPGQHEERRLPAATGRWRWDRFRRSCVSGRRPGGRGPAGIQADPVRASVGAPLSLAIWVTDDSVTGTGAGADHGSASEAGDERRPGSSTPVRGRSSSARRSSAIASLTGTATTSATFKQPGEYVIRVRADNFGRLDTSAGNQCCWTNGYVKVTVT